MQILPLLHQLGKRPRLLVDRSLVLGTPQNAVHGDAQRHAVRLHPTKHIRPPLGLCFRLLVRPAAAPPPEVGLNPDGRQDSPLPSPGLGKSPEGALDCHRSDPLLRRRPAAREEPPPLLDPRGVGVVVQVDKGPHPLPPLCEVSPECALNHSRGFVPAAHQPPGQEGPRGRLDPGGLLVHNLRPVLSQVLLLLLPQQRPSRDPSLHLLPEAVRLVCRPDRPPGLLLGALLTHPLL
mmetsp:Transcript_9603/g.33167  ORF Transcript_9603/g.33167 Transcript_9603/m.33167 type:complete len:235 (-) Transcript_9603:377-1081(-)